MRLFLSADDQVIDVGAGTGKLTLPLARVVGASGRVYAFESSSTVYNMLCGNWALNSIENVKPVDAIHS